MTRTLEDTKRRRRLTCIEHPRAFSPWYPEDDRLLLRLARTRRNRWGSIDWIAIARRTERTLLAVQSRLVILRAAPRLAVLSRAKAKTASG